MLICFVMREQHVLHMFVLQAVDMESCLVYILGFLKVTYS